MNKKFLIIGFLAILSVFGAQDGYAAKEKKASMPAVVADNMTVELEYTLTVDGTVVDSSKGHGPLKYEQGKGQIIPGLEKQMNGLHVGDSKEVVIKPEDAYGSVDPNAFVEISREKLPPNPPPQVGMMLHGKDLGGRSMMAKITEVKEKTVRLDTNHPLAGKTLNFKIKVISVTPTMQK